MSEAVTTTVTTPAATETPATPVPVGQLESVAEYQKRRGEVFDTPAEDKPVESATPAPKADDKPATDVEPDAASEAGKALAKQKNSLQARIDELTRKNGESERQFRQREAELLAKLAALETGKPATDADGNKPQADSKSEYKRIMAMPGAPKVSDFDTYEEYTFAAGEFIADVKAAQREQKQNGDAARRGAADAENKAYEAAKAAHPDVDDVMDSFMKGGGFFSPVMADVIRNHPLGGEIGYQLAKNPERNAAIVALRHPGLEMIEIGKLIGEIEAKAKAGEKPADPPKPKVSAAPAPVEPVTPGETSTARPDPANISSVKTWERERSRFLNAA